MIYRNKKTGVFLDSDSTLAGVWEEYNPSEPQSNEQEEQIDEPEKNTEAEDIKKTDEIEESEAVLTVAEIKKELDAFGIEYDPKAKKDELLKLLESIKE